MFLHLAFFSHLLLYPLRVSLLVFSTFLVFLTKCCSSYAVIFFFYALFPSLFPFLLLFPLLSLFPILLFLFEFFFSLLYTYFFSLPVVFHLVIYPTFIFPSWLFSFAQKNQRYLFFASRVTSTVTRQHFLMLYKQPIHNTDCTTQILQHCYT